MRARQGENRKGRDQADQDAAGRGEPAIDHEIDIGAVMVWLRLTAACGMKCGVELRSQGKSMVTETCPRAKVTAKARMSPATAPVTASIRFSISTCSRICGQDQPIGLEDGQFAAPFGDRRCGRAPDEGRGKDLMIAAMISPMLCERNSTPLSACRIESSLDTTPCLPSSAVILATTLFKLFPVGLDQDEIGVVGPNG